MSNLKFSLIVFGVCVASIINSCDNSTNFRVRTKMGNPKEKRYGQFVPITDKTLNEPESEQQLTHYYKIIFSLKNGKQIEICSRESYKPRFDIKDDFIVVKGFIKNPLLVEKTVKINPEEIAAIESIKDPCIAQVIPWPNVEGGKVGDDGFGTLGTIGEEIPIVGGTKEPSPSAGSLLIS